MPSSKPRFPAGGPKTLEVDASWLEPEVRNRKGERPPPIPGSNKRAPPMPVEPVGPVRRDTMEVKAEWLEPLEGEPKGRKSRASLVPANTKEKDKKKKPPIPREE